MKNRVRNTSGPNLNSSLHHLPTQMFIKLPFIKGYFLVMVFVFIQKFSDLNLLFYQFDLCNSEHYSV